MVSLPGPTHPFCHISLCTVTTCGLIRVLSPKPQGNSILEGAGEGGICLFSFLQPKALTLKVNVFRQVKANTVP